MAACLQILYRPLQPPIQHPHSRQRARLRLHQRLHPPLDGLGQSGRRREADKRIALSSRNDIFDQHFHITPAEALSRASLRSLTLGFFSFFHPLFPSNFPHPPLIPRPSRFLRFVPSFRSAAFYFYPSPFRYSPPNSYFPHLFLSRFSSFFSSSFSSSSSSRPDHRMASYRPSSPLAIERDFASRLRLGSAPLIDSFIRRHSYYKSRRPI